MELMARKAKAKRHKSKVKYIVRYKEINIGNYVFSDKPLPIFNILPSTYFHSIIRHLLSSLDLSIVNQINQIKGYKTMFTFKCGINPPANFSYASPVLGNYIKKAVLRVRYYRGIFKRFLHRWRASRLPVANTDDIITLAPPRQPIYLIDWQTRRKYLYEASSLMKDITTRLMNHDGFFEDPQLPRNLFTNTPFTQAQTISIWLQLSMSTTTSVAFTAFRQCRWNMHKYMIEYSIMLQLHSLRNTLKPNNIDGDDRLLDFLQFVYTQEGIVLYENSFRFIMKNHPHHYLLHKWRNLCIQYYEADLLYLYNPVKRISMQNIVLDNTVDLLEKQTIFKYMYLASLRK